VAEGQPTVLQGESKRSVLSGEGREAQSTMEGVLKGILETVQATEERSALLHQRILDTQLPANHAHSAPSAQPVSSRHQDLAPVLLSSGADADRWSGVHVGNRGEVGGSGREGRYYAERGGEDWNLGREGSFEADERLTSQLDSAVPLSGTRARVRTRPHEKTDPTYLGTQERAWGQRTLRRQEKDLGRRVRQEGQTWGDEARYARYLSPSPPGRYRSSLPSPDPFPPYSYPDTQQEDVLLDVPRGRGSDRQIKGRKQKGARAGTGGKRTVRDLLAAVGLSAFEDMLIRNGWDSVQRIKMLAEDDLV